MSISIKKSPVRARCPAIRLTLLQTNPKSEIRISKSETKSEQINFKSEKTQITQPEGSLFWFAYFGHLKLFRIADFVLRNFC